MTSHVARGVAGRQYCSAMTDRELFPDWLDTNDEDDVPLSPTNESEGRPAPRRRRIALRIVGIAALGLLIVFVGVDRSIVHRFEARMASLPSRTYAVPFSLARGGRVDATALRERLTSLGYREVAGDPAEPGEFRRKGNDWIVHLRTSVLPQGKRGAFPVELRVRWGRLGRITDLRDGTRLEAFTLEPEPLFTFYADLMEERRWTPLEEVPEEMVLAIVAVEDRRFLRHHGIDLIGIGRAMFANVRAAGFVQGGSTITQQLAKNLYGPGKRSLRRKLLETAAALALELHYDKDEIFEAYLNEVYLGQLGPVAISGIGDASRFFFGAHVQDLDLVRSALLAGMIRNPGRYNPRRNAEQARERRDLVLRLMVEQELIDEDLAASATAAPLGLGDATLSVDRLPWIESYLENHMDPLGTDSVPSRSGFSVYTTFDARIQHAAQSALESGLSRLEQRIGPDATEPLEGAVVVLRPADGAVLALVGGRDYRRSQFNRAIQARRPPGSTMKPFVHLAAIERARHDGDFEFTLASVLDDTPLELRAGGQLWRPTNYDRRHRGQVSAREALERSINVPTVRAAMDVGLPAVVEMARRCGIESELQAIPSLALGSEEVSPLELAAAYATLANGGLRVRPHALLAVVDRDGDRTSLVSPETERAVGADSAYLITDVLVGAVERGTGRSAARLGFTGTAAGKTGSSDGLRDAWFVGYTPNVLALVWVGYDDNRPIGLSGAAAALPIWVDLMQRLGADDADAFPQPAGIVRRKVDPATGQRATRRCPEARHEIFLRGAEPEQPCERHGGTESRGFWRRVFGK
jgi:penicillin-binding protein 1B